MRKLVVLVIVVAMLSVCGAAMAIGLPKMGGAPAASNGAPTGNPDDFVKKAADTDALYAKGVDALTGLIASKEQLAEIQALQDKIKATTDPKEKESLSKKLQESQSAALSDSNNLSNLEANAKGWDDKKKKQAKDSLYNVGLGSLRATDLVAEGQSIAQSLQSNPMNAPKAMPVVKSVNTLKNIGISAGKILASLPDVLGKAKITPELPKSSADAPKDLTL